VYTWDAANRLVSANVDGVVSSFEYDGSGNRTAQMVAEVTTEYVLDVGGGLPEVILATTGGASTRYVQVQGQILGQQESGAWVYILPDHLGSVRQLVGSDSQVSLAQSYEPFEGSFESAGSGASEFGYTGEWWDAEAELLYLRARYYDPAVGRFVSKDRFLGDFNQPQTFNGWSYVEGNPINSTDPIGLWRFADATHRNHQLIEDAWWIPLPDYRHVEFPIPGAGVGGAVWRADMITSDGAVFELEPIYKQAAGRREIKDKLRALRLARGQYPPGIIDWNRMRWHLGAQLEFGTIIRVQHNLFYDLIADWIEDGLVVYWAEERPRPVYVPIPEHAKVNKRLLKPRDWHPLNPQPAGQPAYVVAETCGKIVVYTGYVIIALTLVEDITAVGIADDAITVPAGVLLIKWGERIAAWAQSTTPAMSPALP
jgi:RHS repeat-associated protein